MGLTDLINRHIISERGLFMKTKAYSKITSLVLAVCMLFSVIICLMSVPATADSAQMLVWTNVPFYSRLHYRPDTGNFVPGGKYMFSFDFDNQTDVAESNLWQILYRTEEDENSFVSIAYNTLNITKSELANGYHYDVVFTVPDNCYATDNILFKFGDVTSNGYTQNMKVGNLDLWKLDESDEKETQIPLSLPESVSSIPTVKTDNVIKNYGYVGKWMGIYAYMTGISIADQDGYFKPEISNPFGTPNNTVRFYAGGANVFAEYVDNDIALPAGDYTFGCKYKELGAPGEYALYYSSDNGATYTKAELSVKDTKKFNRMAYFTLESAANAVKIVIGNPTDATNVNLALAGVYLCNDEENKQLLEEITESTVNRIGITDINTNKKWNIHTDADNAGAFELIPYNNDYFAPQKITKTYENIAGKQYAYILYKNADFVAEAGKEYLVLADYKVEGGTFTYDDVCKGKDPAFRVKVGNYVLENANTSRFTGLASGYDELTGKLYVRFARSAKTTKLEIIAGNYSATSYEGACAVGNVGIYECYTKADGVTVYKDNLIEEMTEETLYSPQDGNKDNALDHRWNTIYVNSAADEFKISDYSADYFKPSAAMYEIKDGGKGAYVSYVDDSLELSAGKIYKLTFNTKTVYGTPEFSLGVKTVNGVSGADYSEISETAGFLTYFNDEFEKETYLRTVSFMPKVNISGIRILFGNISANNNSESIIANASLCNVDNSGIVIGDNLLARMIKQTTKRNTAEQRIWNLVSAKEKDIDITIPIRDGMFVLEKMLKIEPNNMWNRVEYYGMDFKVKSNTTYRYTADFMSISGNPSFSLMFYDKTTKEYTSFSKISTSYTDISDTESNIRGYEFTTRYLNEAEIKNVGEIRIFIGNGTDAKDISAVYANPQLYVIEDGKPVGDNLITPITDDTVQYMGTMSYDNIWNLRYQGSAGVAVKVLDIPDNYFRSPAFVTKNASGTVSQIFTAKPNTYYKLYYYVRTSAGKINPYVKSISSSGVLSDITAENVIEDGDGYFSYSCEFKTPASLQTENNLRVGVSFDTAADGAVTNFQLYELNSGFEKTGTNLITDGSFTAIKELAEYTGTDQSGWTFEGTEGNSGISARANGYFNIPTSKMFIFVGGSANNSLSHTATLEKGKNYNLSFNLKYANPGYEGETGVDILYTADGTTWKTLDCTDISPEKEFKKSYNLTLPADAAASNNFKFSVRAGSDFVSGYIANAVLTDTESTGTNLLKNGDFSDGLVGWETQASFKSTYFADIPDGYFDNPQSNKPGMIVYRNSGSWENFCQSYLNLKPGAYYYFKGNAVHPWQPDTSANGISVYSVQMSGKDEEGKSVSPFMSYCVLAKCTNKCTAHTNNNEYVALYKGSTGEKDRFDNTIYQYTCEVCGKVYTQEEFDKLDSIPQNTDNGTFVRVYKTLSQMDSGSNTLFRFVMQVAENAGYWGSVELYECDVHGNILSNNIFINGDFSLGLVGWNIAPSDKFNYRIVEQPDGFFDNYKRNGEKMITSAGTSKNAVLGQSIDVERGKTYYFSGFYVNMNAAGIVPKIMYTTVDGNYAEVPVTLFYDPNRFFFEIAFTLPEDAKTNRGNTKVDFIINNTDGGKAFISDLAVYEEGKYENLFKNADFKSGFSNWNTNSNYVLAPYDASVFVFYYDDKMFDDGDWSGTAVGEITGTVTGKIVDGSGNGLKNIKVTLKPAGLSVKTDKDGMYTFANLRAGEYQLYVTAPDGTSMFVNTVDVRAGMSTGVSMITLFFEEDEELDLVEYDTEYTYGVVRGYLFDSNGNPLKGQKLFLGKVGELVTKNKGEFQFNEVQPGEYDLYTVLEDGSIHIFKRIKVVAGKGSIYKVKMPAKSGLSIWWIIAIIVGGVVLLCGTGAVVVIIVIAAAAKKKRKK